MDEIPVGCARPVGATTENEKLSDLKPGGNISKEEKQMIKVGQKAPDFTAPGFHKGKFINVTLSDYKGKWVLLCFYPGDFTFV